MLDIVTSGMYNNPLMIYKEYIQNSADSIDEYAENNKATQKAMSVQIDIDGGKREISILDNGTGVPQDQVEQCLCSLGLSKKEGSNSRGFRGIGRLGGLGYCDLLRFETRSSKTEPISIVEWKNPKLLASDKNLVNIDLEDVVKDVVHRKIAPATPKDPEHFFKVTLVNVHRFHTDVLMNIKMVETYLSQVSPLPYRTEEDVFRFGEELNSFFSSIPNYKTYNICLNGTRLFKPYTNTIDISTNQQDIVREIKKLEFTSHDTGKLLGLGWFAISSFKSSLPKHISMRGVRVKHGNIEVGDERFLERMTIIGKGLSNLCRESSLKRSLEQKVQYELDQIIKSVSSTSVVLDSAHHEKIVERTNKHFSAIDQLILTQKIDSKIKQQIDRARKQASSSFSSKISLYERLDGRKIKCLSRKDLVYEICKNILENYSKDKPIEEVLKNALCPFYVS